MIGSHIDTVNDAGAYDGTLGVIAGILAVREIIRRHGTMPFGIDVLAFGDEEGSRFPATLLCSQAVTGHFDPAWLAVESVDGVRLDEALRQYGKDPARIREAAYDMDEAAAYVEVHIEQGPVLEQQDEALGVVTAIASQSRHTVTVVGEAGHAGRYRWDCAATPWPPPPKWPLRSKALLFAMPMISWSRPSANSIAGPVLPM